MNFRLLQSTFNNNFESINSGTINYFCEVKPSFEAAILINYLKVFNKNILLIANDAIEAQKIEQDLAFWQCDFNVFFLPAWDSVPYGRNSPNSHIQSQRIKTLWSLASYNSDKPYILISTANAIIQRVIPKSELNDAAIMLKKSSEININELTNLFTKLGYHRVSVVREHGEFAIRGDIVDLWAMGQKNALRIDLFGDEIDNLKFFDVTTQRSFSEEIQEFYLLPASEVLLNEEKINNFKQNYRKISNHDLQKDTLYTSITEGKHWSGCENWLPLFYNKLDTVFDYINGTNCMLTFQVEEAIKAQINSILDYYNSRQVAYENKVDDYVGVEVNSLYLSEKELFNHIKQHPHYFLSPYTEAGETRLALGAQKPADFSNKKIGFEQLATEINDWFVKTGKAKRLIVCKNKANLARIEQIFNTGEKNNLFSISHLQQIDNIKKPNIALIQGKLQHGFVFDDWAILTDSEILGEKKQVKKRSKRKFEDVVTQATNINVGDYLVHEDHGIGKFEGLETITSKGHPHDCVKLSYEGGDKLYIPVENLDVLSVFAQEGEAVRLDKLGSSAWQYRKAKAKNRINEMAEKLMELAAQRELSKGIKIAAPEGIYQEFCAKFPYEETEDQLNAIEDIMEDFLKSKTSDRLICGDVGFGKTEVALRSAFVAAISGHQVALIVPTTLLARQHYQNFKQRFEGFPIKVAQLSRMVTPKQAKETKKAITDGTIDIVVGTHALLAKTIKFKRLALVIVDEEQHFGVAHKERLKELRNDIHMLTLTATPIPRTLQMALTGLRDLSIIATPPVDRMSIRTFVQSFDAVVVKEAILKERYRGGQCFFVCPRLKDISLIEKRLRSMLPDIRLAIAHGQMSSTELDKVISNFVDGEFDVLLSTQIVESGIDMPNVNTIFIYRADMFGLSQLYQLRGRVGRGDKRAWAWLLTEPGRTITKSASARLDLMQTLDNLGAGFTLASHDLDQRGAGNLLGEEQSGHIKEVGVELYQQMLKDAIEKAREEKSGIKFEDKDEFYSKVNLDIPIIIAEDYIPDLDIRMQFYRKIAALQTIDDISQIEEELEDRFGKVPKPVQNLLTTVMLKQRCQGLNIEQLDVGTKGIVIKFWQQTFAKPEAIIKYIQQNPGLIKLRKDQSLFFLQSLNNDEAKIKFANHVLSKLENLT